MNYFLESATEITREEGHQKKLVNQKKFELGFLKRKCINLELEPFYQAYMLRLRRNHLFLFITILSVVSIVHCILILATVTSLIKSDFYIDISVYLLCVVVISGILSMNFRLSLVKRYVWIAFVTSWIGISLLVLMDISLPIFRAVTNYDLTVPAYYSFALYSIYIFMPLSEDVNTIIMGGAVTVCYVVIFAFVSYRRPAGSTSNIHICRVASEAIFMACVNLLGIFFRLTLEVAIRTTFLDKRQCVEENLLLRAARDQEKNLLLSIIPSQIADKIEEDVKMRIEHLKRRAKFKSTAGLPRKLFIEPHHDVTVLYADVVNYTYLTTTVDVKTLVETLHDLFVTFDIASQEYSVQRIKFLGDCYYCVAGVSIPNDHHARSCVNLGLRMIKDIRDIRLKRKLNIDMRIGVHSGNVLSGVIGANKWQFDIWSKDVDIANRLESTGKAGRVHVSEQTLQLLDGEFMYEEGTALARQDPVLRKHMINTFLIKPPSSKTSFEAPRRSARKKFELRSQESRLDLSTNFMQSTISQYNQVRSQATLEMSREVDKMPIGRIQLSKMFVDRSKRLTQDEMEEQGYRRNISSVLLLFKDWHWELMYLSQPDVMLKYSVLVSYVTMLSVMVMQAINLNQFVAFWELAIISNLLMIIITIITWYKKMWIVFLSKAESSRPRKKFSYILYKISDRVQRNFLARIAIYLLVLILSCTSIAMQLQDCHRYKIENEEIEIQLFEDGERDFLCFNAWTVTESFLLNICIAFLFTSIPFLLKMTVGGLIFLIYTILITVEFDFIYERSLSTNKHLYAECAHVMVLCVTVVIFYLMDRQTEFISKVDYNWKRQLQKKHDDAKFTNETISILISNILPIHVADIYMTKQMSNELYYEEYDNVAVMFATIRNYDTDQVGIRVLNEIICDFDDVLSRFRGPLRIEKIKVAGWTYMAACGLDPKRSEYRRNQNSFRTSSLLPNGRRSNYGYNRSSMEDTDSDLDPYGHDDERDSFGDPYPVYEGHRSRDSGNDETESNDLVYVMAEFALQLMRTMHYFNVENLQCEDQEQDGGMLRIGISHGPVMAGVVGSSKPHYDIWGNAVNMASRMDSTGKPGSIQVTEETARILQTYGIKCTYRGLTNVKGRGPTPTYFIEIDKRMEFVRRRKSSMSVISLSTHPQETENLESYAWNAEETRLSEASHASRKLEQKPSSSEDAKSTERLRSVAKVHYLTEATSEEGEPSPEKAPSSEQMYSAEDESSANEEIERSPEKAPSSEQMYSAEDESSANEEVERPPEKAPSSEQMYSAEEKSSTNEKVSEDEAQSKKEKDHKE